MIVTDPFPPDHDAHMAAIVTILSDPIVWKSFRSVWVVYHIQDLLHMSQCINFHNYYIVEINYLRHAVFTP